MLLIPDIHINSRYADDIINTIKRFIEEHQDEKNIVFLGDYVYHFSYDRGALLALYDLFVELFTQGKNVYILAGNHDRLGSSFVFQEVQKAFEIISGLNDKDGKLKFITEPLLENIEGQNILFFPFMLNVYATGKDYSQNIENHKINQQTTELKLSKNKNEQISAEVNELLLNHIGDKTDLLVIHHHYINGETFPGQKSKFSFKNIALSKEFLNLKGIRMISGHLHSCFSQDNYLCLGNVWNTSPLEVNQVKYLASLNNHKVTLYPQTINPYFLIELEENSGILNQRLLEQHIQKVQSNSKSNFHSKVWNICFGNTGPIDLKKISIFLKVDDIDYEKMKTYIDSELVKKLKDVKLKKDMHQNKNYLEDMRVYDSSKLIMFSDWKDIIQKYLKTKYPDDVDRYIALLSEIKLM